MEDYDANELTALEPAETTRDIPRGWFLPRGISGFVRALAVIVISAWIGWQFSPVLALPTLAMMMPALLIWGARRGGLFAAVIGAAALTYAVYVKTPAWTIGLVPLVLLPVMAYRYLCAKTRWPFTVTWIGCFVCLLGSALGAFQLVAFRLDTNPIQYAFDTLEQWLTSSPQSGAVLLDAYRVGLAKLSAEPFALQFGSSIWIAPAQKRELIASLIAALEGAAASYLPGDFVTGAVLCATFISISSPDGGPSGAPAFDKWYLPVRGVAGIFMSVTLALVVLNLLSGGVFAMASSLAVSAVQTGLAILGASVLDSMLSKRGIPIVIRRVLIIICYAVFGIALAVLGFIGPFRRILERNKAGKEE